MTPARPGRALLGPAAAVLAALTIAACTSTTTAGNVSSSGADVVSPPPSSSVAAPSSAPASAGATGIAPSSSAAPSRTRTSSSAGAPASTAPPARRSTCTSVTVRVIRGGAITGQEFAALQFVNTGTSPCTLYGYPTLTLLLHGSTIGVPAQPATPAASQRLLAPGAVAESQLHDYISNCQAQLSDNVRVGVPGSSIYAVRPAQLRACTLRVDALTAPQ